MSVDIKKDNKFWDMMNLVPKQLPAPEPKNPDFFGPGPRGFEGMGYEEWKREGIPKELNGKGFEEILRAYFDWDGFIPEVTTDGMIVKAKQIPKSPALEKMREKYRYEQDKLAQHKKEHERLHKLAEEEKKKKADTRTTNEIRLAYLCANGKKASAKLSLLSPWDQEEIHQFIQISINERAFSYIEKSLERGYWVTADSFKSESFPHLQSDMVFKAVQEKWEPIGKHWVYTVILTEMGA